MFHAEGSLSIGFVYPNMYMAEDYNSPQSVYWCLKSFFLLALGPEDEFWSCEEEAYPLAQTSGLVEAIWPSRHILVNDSLHTFLLSSGQTTKNPFKAREAKYGKFAYSSAFGFSVPTGSLLHQIAPDSTLAVSVDGGESWSVRWSPFDVQLREIKTTTGERKPIRSLCSSWKPWKHLDLIIETVLIPLAEISSGWHVRVHRIRWSAMPAWVESLQIVDGGFAIASETKARRFIGQTEAAFPDEGWVLSPHGASSLVRSQAGTSGIVDLSHSGGHSSCAAEVIRTDPNTNLVAPRAVLPVLKHTIPQDSTQKQGQQVLVTGVLAASASSQTPKERVEKAWLGVPKIRIGETGEIVVA